jgi:hypothetical protein
MFSDLTNKELRVLGAKLDHGGLAVGDRLFPDRNMEVEILALSAEVHDLAQHRLEARRVTKAQADPEAGDGGDAVSDLEPGTGEYAYEVLMSDAEREECDRQLRTAAEERAAGAEARLDGLERDAAALGRDIFGRPLAPGAPQPEAEA